MTLVKVTVDALEFFGFLEDELSEEVIIELWEAQFLQLDQEGDGERFLMSTYHVFLRVGLSSRTCDTCISQIGE